MTSRRIPWRIDAGSDGVLARGTFSAPPSVRARHHRCRHRHRLDRQRRGGGDGPPAGGAGNIQTAAIILAALIEGATLFALVITILIVLLYVFGGITRVRSPAGGCPQGAPIRSIVLANHEATSLRPPPARRCSLAGAAAAGGGGRAGGLLTLEGGLMFWTLIVFG
jgi:hypothetical protein